MPVGVIVPGRLSQGGRGNRTSSAAEASGIGKSGWEEIFRYIEL